MPVDDLKTHAQSGHDFYALLDVAPTATESEIRRAYRRTALKYHPDKHGGSTEAIEKFHLLQIANDVLSDSDAKAIYDSAREARRQKLERESAFGDRRRKLKEDLERRESGAKRARDEEDIEAERREAEIRRLRADGAARVERKRQELQREMEAKAASTANTSVPNDLNANEAAQGSQVSDLDRTVKVKWQRLRPEEAVSRDDLEKSFSSFGEVDGVVMLKEKRKRVEGIPDKVNVVAALIMFKSVASALGAVEDALKQKEVDATLAVIEEVDWASGTEPVVVREMRNAAPGTIVTYLGLSGDETTRIRLRLASQRQRENKAAQELAKAQQKQAKAEQEKKSADARSTPDGDEMGDDSTPGRPLGIRKVPSFASFKRGAATPQKGAAPWSTTGTPISSPVMEQLKRNRAREEERRRLEKQIRLEDEATMTDNHETTTAAAATA